MFVVGRYNRFVQVDTTGNASSATVGQIPCNRVGLVHVGETFPRITPYFYPHQIIYRYGYVYHGIRSVVSQIEICRSAVLSSNKDIRIKLDGEYGNADAVVTADGDIQGYIKNADEVIITESEYDFELIKIGEQSFYDTLIKKLS